MDQNNLQLIINYYIQQHHNRRCGVCDRLWQNKNEEFRPRKQHCNSETRMGEQG